MKPKPKMKPPIKPKSNSFFGVMAKSQSYLNMLYLLLSFPFGLFYFVFLVTGLSLGFSLTIIWVGIPILLGVLIAWYGFAALERQLATILLKVKIPYATGELMKESKLWKRLKIHISESTTWKSLAFLFIKFPLGIVSFVVLVTAISITLSFIATPFLFFLSRVGVVSVLDNPPEWLWFMSTAWFSIIVGLFGILFAFISIHIFNGIAYVSGQLAKAMLKKEEK